MAMIDHELELSDAQAITSTDATASTNIIDLSATGRAIREGEGKLMCSVNTAFDSSGDAMTLTVVVETDDDSAFGSATTLDTISAVPQATLVAGYKIFERAMADFAGKLERYLRLTYQCGTEAATAGKVDAYVGLNSQSA